MVLSKACNFLRLQKMTSLLSAAADAFVPSGALAGNAAKQMHLASPSEEEARGVRLVASASGVLDRLAVSYDAHDLHMALKNEKGELVSGHINTICRYLASVGERSEQLLGSSPETQAQVGFQSCSRRLNSALVCCCFKTGCCIKCCVPCSFSVVRSLQSEDILLSAKRHAALICCATAVALTIGSAWGLCRCPSGCRSGTQSCCH